MRSRTIRVPFWGTLVTVYVGGDPIAAAKAIERKLDQTFDDTDPDREVDGFVQTAGGHSCIWYTDRVLMHSPVSDGIIAHECVHAAHDILADNGVDVSEEIVAFLAGYLVEKVVAVLDKMREPQPRKVRGVPRSDSTLDPDAVREAVRKVAPWRKRSVNLGPLPQLKDPPQ